MKARRKPDIIIDLESKFKLTFHKVSEYEVNKLNKKDPLKYSMSKDGLITGLYISTRNFDEEVGSIFLKYKNEIHLKFLSIIHCDLNRIEFLSDYSELLYLSLWNNDIDNIEALEYLRFLKFINLSNNKIRNVDSLINIPKDATIILSNNKITHLPAWFCNFENDIVWRKTLSANKVHLFGNPLQSPPTEIVAQGSDAIKNYFQQIKVSTEVEYLNEAKLILVGEERAGKSTIAAALKYRDFTINQNNKSTEGIDITEWIISKEESKLETDFKFNIWDFGGQEIYHSTHQFFLTKRSLYLFITEARKDLRFDDFYYWLNIISSLAGDSPILMIQNKIDQPHRDHSISEYKEYFQNIKGSVIKVSCNTDHPLWEKKYRLTVEFLRQSIFDNLDKKSIRGMGDPLPKSWITIRETLAKIKNSGVKFIDLKRYIDICEEHGVKYYQALYLSDYYHDLGVFLHFKSDVHLQNTIFLDHEWVTMAVYKVLDNIEVKESFGKFTDDDLIRIWTGDELQGKRSELLSLMKNKEFNICYQHNDGFYLAPQLFSTESIKYEINRENKYLNFRYSYKFMPKGILSKLIVILNHFVYEDYFWQYGVVLKYKDSEAMIVEKRFKNENVIDIKSSGANSRDMLVIIGNVVEKINESFSNLSLVEEFACSCKECKLSTTPYYFKSTTINRAIDRSVDSLECQVSFERINIDTLLGYYFTDEHFNKYRKENLVDVENIYSEVLDNFGHKEILSKLGIIEKKIDHLSMTSELFYEKYLSSQGEDSNIKTVVEDILNKSNKELISKLTLWLETAFSVVDQQLFEDFEELKSMFGMAKKTSNFEVKTKISVPLISLLGIHVETKFDLLKFYRKVENEVLKRTI